MSTDTVTDNSDIHRAGTGDRAGLNRVLAAAFLDDPVFRWLVPDDEERAPLLVPLFDLFADAFARHGETHVAAVGGTASGAAMWSPPGVAPVHPDDEPALGEGMAAVCGPHMERMAICLEIFEAAHPREPAWFLQFLGVDPAAQGLGLGSALLRATLARADAAGEAAYLEATSDRNRALYERHGFRCIGELPLPDGPVTYAMWRDPAPIR
ncbi:MAG: GNAT family N-acetyltransferase [Actinomycetota bacterium]|nr:GNAT family N-acetyltransferase [Actinomycetota bacterium]